MISSMVSRVPALGRPLILRGLKGGVQPSIACQSYAAPAPTAQPTQSAPAVYGSQFEVYKGKAAVQFKPIGCTFVEVDGGNLEMKRKGVLLMELANAVGKRNYDWANKITFALSVTEMAELFLTNTVLQGNTVSLFHDPSMGSSTQGQVQKSLKAGLMPDQLNVGINVSEMANGGNRAVSVQLSAAEFLVVAEMCRYLIPRALGMERLF